MTKGLRKVAEVQAEVGMMADVELLKAKRHALFVAKNTNRYGDYDRLCAMIADLDRAIRLAEERGPTGVQPSPGKNSNDPG